MRVLSTQAQHADTDLDVTMKFPIQFFRPPLAAVTAMTLVGCGGGGSSSVVVEPTGNPHLVSADSRIMSPKLMTISGTDIYIANQGNSGVNGILKISSNDGLSASGFVGLTDAIGMATNPSGSVYVTGKYFGTPRISNLVPNSIALIIGSQYGFTFDGNSNLYVADVSTLGGRAPTVAFIASPSYSSWGSSFSAETPKGFALKNGFIYFTTDEGNIYKFAANTNIPTQLILSGPPLTKPNGIAFAGDIMYVVNYGNADGTGSWIAKIVNESVVTEFKKDPNWLCASAGIAYRNNYIYVSNGPTTNASGCGNIQNTIVKFFH